MTSRTALITGASSGIGAAFARSLASRGYRLVLVARREARLRSLAEEVERRSDVGAEVFPCDLSDPAQVQRLEILVAGRSDLEMLVNNAGFGAPGAFVEVPPEKVVEMVQVHVLAVMRLCRAALPGMISRGRGSIINVSSVAAFMAAPKTVTYSATKACLNVFSERLRDELKGTGVRVQALCPGLTRTEFHDRPGYENYKEKIPGFLWMTAEEVVKESLAGLDKNRMLCVPGFKNRLIAAIVRNRPGAFAVKMLAALSGVASVRRAALKPAIGKSREEPERKSRSPENQ